MACSWVWLGLRSSPPRRTLLWPDWRLWSIFAFLDSLPLSASLSHQCSAPRELQPLKSWLRLFLLSWGVLKELFKVSLNRKRKEHWEPWAKKVGNGCLFSFVEVWGNTAEFVRICPEWTFRFLLWILLWNGKRSQSWTWLSDRTTTREALSSSAEVRPGPSGLQASVEPLSLLQILLFLRQACKHYMVFFSVKWLLKESPFK